MYRSLEESVEMMSCCSEVDSEDEQQCYEVLEDQQVWEKLEDEVMMLIGWEEAEPEGCWQPSKDNWEQSQDNMWEEPESVDPGLKSEEWVHVTESTTPSLEKEQSNSAAMDEVAPGLTAMTGLPAAPVETSDISSQGSVWTTFSERLQRSWRNFKSFLTISMIQLLCLLL